tara:strand:- start:861 stop:1625 length:765 start_codon:yes stop_codon:yes gene_type:complete
MDPRNLIERDGLVMDFNAQQILSLKNGKQYPLIGNSRLAYKRGRDNKEQKILHASSSASEEVWFSSNHQLLSYDHLIAIDTNTNPNPTADFRVSITAAYHLIPRHKNYEQAACHARILALIELWNVVEKPENVGWWQILQALAGHPITYAGKIGLIVDSDLGNHQAFNDRSLPIIGDYYLPDNVSIIYGSDKGGAEHLSTKMIKYCHDLAADVYKQKMPFLNPLGLQKGVDGLYTHIRQWDTEEEGLRPFIDNQ